jgi:hypothetical protein
LIAEVAGPTSAVTFRIEAAAGMAKEEERRGAFGDVLSASLVRVTDFLKFAETKNAALLTFASAWDVRVDQPANRRPCAAGILGRAF